MNVIKAGMYSFSLSLLEINVQQVVSKEQLGRMWQYWVAQVSTVCVSPGRELRGLGREGLGWRVGVCSRNSV